MKILCNYGCGQEAKHQLRNGKWCCSKRHQSCPVNKKKNSNSNIGRKYTNRNKAKKTENLNFLLCDYGCGKVAKYKFNNGKFCCKNHFAKCSAIKEERKHNKNVIKAYETKTIKKIKIESKENIKCSYGCGNDAAYHFINVDKFCCSSHYLKCPSKHNETIKNQKLIPVVTKNICDFGCGKIAKFVSLKSEKYCCSKNWAMCLNIINKNSETNKIVQVGENNAMYGRNHSEESKRKMSEAQKKLWRDPNSVFHTKEYKKKQLEGNIKVLKEYNVSPNKPEKFLIELLNNIIPNEYQYVGDFSFWIDGKNPDFVNHNKKKIIEHFGDYWHDKETTGIDNKIHEKERIDHFKKEGYKTLIIWEHELKDINKLTSKIIKFNKGNKE